jgi:hypothetical protein
MKKIYNRKVIQYSLDGTIIDTFPTPQAATHIINYDSIISCCKGKYKTAGGYVWRFEGEPFTIAYTKEITGQNHTCNICSSTETIRSMSMHLKWVHNISTEKYVEQYGEFRPKQLKAKSKLNPKFTCKECGEILNGNRHLMFHINKAHPEITQSEYIIKHMLEGNEPTCKCGCGEKVNILINGRNCDLNKDTYHRDYIKGHVDWDVFSSTGKQSKEEIELLEYIQSIYPGKIQTNLKGIVPRNEIDIYLPELSIGIEYNGLYWHSEKGGRMKDYHTNKTAHCSSKGIHLIQIFSDEWLNKKDIVKAKLQSILKVTPKENTIYARKCYVKEIPSNQKNTFLNAYHIQGEDRSTIKLGLFHIDELVAVMTFSTPRISLGASYTPNTYELSRYASSMNVIGGASKLIKYFTTTYNPTQIYSYSDNRWTNPDKNMYLSIGFTKVHSSSPGYFYTKDYLTRIHRYNFTKYHLKKMGADTKNKTERQIMEEMGYTRVWDCGSTKYILYL